MLNFFFITLFFLTMKSSCSSTDSSKNTAYSSLLQTLFSGSVPVITVDELSKIQTEGTILDTRETDEYNVSRIPGSTHIGYEEFSIVN